MTKFLSIAVLAGVTALAGCYNPRYPDDRVVSRDQEPVRSGSGVPVTAGAGGTAEFRAGAGRVDSISEAAGPGDRVSVRMDNGGAVYTIVQDSSDLRVGDRVHITSDGRVVRR